MSRYRIEIQWCYYYYYYHYYYFVWVQILALAACSAVPSNQHLTSVIDSRIGQQLGWPQLNYYPCLYYGSDYIKCSPIWALPLPDSRRILERFRQNENNTDFQIVSFYDLEDMTNEILTQIMDIITTHNADRMITIEQWTLPKVDRVPQKLWQFPNLQYFQFINTGIKTLPYGSMNFSSNSLQEIQCYSNSQLEVIEPGAFQGK